MTIHRCPTPATRPQTAPFTWTCPECGADYVWSRRMIGREKREGWYRTVRPLSRPAARMTGTDQEFDRWFNRAAVLAVLTWLLVTAGFIALVVWVVLRVTT